MTPEYGAPEQVRGERTTTATDVYQLGVVLYELLTGHHPIPPATSGSAYLAEKAVCEVEPTRPSRVVSRQVWMRQPGGRLWGDLDAIVLKALEKDAARRYGMAEGFADDIRRYLAGLPVEAREGNLRYRARKFLVRHRIPVSTAAGILLILAVGGWLHVERVAEERDVAQLAAVKAQTLTDFMLELFDAGHPEEARGEVLTAPMLLERGVERADALAGQPAVQAEMLATVARAYLGLAEYDRSEELFRRSLAIQERDLGPDHPDVAYSLAHLGWLRALQQDFDASARHFRNALAIQRQVLRPDDPDLTSSMQGLGLALNGLGELDAGVQVIEEALEIGRRSGNTEHVAFANGLNDLAILRRTAGDFEGAESLLREAMALRQRLLSEGHPDLGKSAQYLGSLLHRMGEYTEAESLYIAALANWERSLGPTHPATLSTIRSLAELYEDWERPEDAELYTATLTLRVDTLLFTKR